jgi:hypothetical protein
VAWEPALVWVLLRAFGPLDREAPAGRLGARALELARALCLAARVAARLGPRLEQEAGDTAAGFVAERRRTAAAELAVEGLRDEVARVARELEEPVLWLKFGALAGGGVVAPGSRGAGDLDLLASPHGAARLAAALVARGYRSAPGPSDKHHLPALCHPCGAAVEIHRRLPGVTIVPGRDAELADLQSASLALPDPALPGTLLPTRELLAAHLLVHAVAQHGRNPHAYPLVRVVGDLIDLGAAEDGGAALLPRLLPWVEATVPAPEAAAALELAGRLAAGEVDPLAVPSTPPAVLLHHLLAGALDPRYRRALRLSQWRRGLAEGRSTGRWLRRLGRTLVPERAQMDTLHGPPRYPGERTLRYLSRPFALTLRLVRYGASAVALWRARARTGATERRKTNDRPEGRPKDE